MIIKVCGMREADNIRQVDGLAIDLIGFLFYEGSPRFSAHRPEYLPLSTKRVGVFVNESETVIGEKIEEYGLHFVQLHGTESPDFCARIQSYGVGVIKAFPIGSTDDLPQTAGYTSCCDLFLFDTPTKAHGGSGLSFDWDLLRLYQGPIPFLLSGGIGPDDATRVSDFYHPLCRGIDINSRFEISPGLKNISLLKSFLKNVNKNRHE